MFGNKIYVKRGGKDDGERPFWISFADLMTALMVVFLLVMSVALLSVTDPGGQRCEDIKNLMGELKKIATREVFRGVNVHNEDCRNPAIDFGSLATFEFGKSTLTTAQAKILRSYISEILTIADSEQGQRWFKQVIVEGYTDNTGTYLRNLDLSLRRSERVVCVLLDTPDPQDTPLSDEQKKKVRNLFLVGGYSSNSSKASDELSRRIELKLKFLELSDPVVQSSASKMQADSEVGSCALGSGR